MRFVAMMLLSVTVLLAQAQVPVPAFEVAVVKLSPPPPCAMPPGMKIDKARFIASCQSLKTLIFWAYRVRPDQVAGPEWLNSTRVDVEAKLPDGAREEQGQLMLQSLLADRFKMAVHKENREQPVYALVVGKSGLKMRALEPIAEPETAPPPGSETVGLPGSEIQVSQTGKSSTFSGLGVKGTMDQNGRHFEMSQIAALVGYLSDVLDRPVLDKSSLKGSYAIRLDFTVDQIRQATSADSGPGGRVALILNAAEKLGLKLEPEKATVEMIVVDHIEGAPSEN